jgi:hypothetical protein
LGALGGLGFVNIETIKASEEAISAIAFIIAILIPY